MKYIVIVSIVILGMIGLLFMRQTSANEANPQKMSIQTIQNDTKNGGQLVDVRTPEEYAAGHIDGAINLPIQDIQAGTMPTVAKDEPIYVYCRSGNRSGQATTVLKSAGYKNIIDLGAMTSVQSLGGIIKT